MGIDNRLHGLHAFAGGFGIAGGSGFGSLAKGGTQT